MSRLLIAHSSEIFVQNLLHRLDGSFDTRICSDGNRVSFLLDTFHPDILILSTAIYCKDALTILRELVDPPQFILVVTNFLPAHMESLLYSLGVHRILLMPSADTVSTVLSTCLETPKPTQNPEQLVRCQLRKLNLPSHMAGFAQICTAVPLLLQESTQTLSKHIYPAVAKIHNISDQRAVEHDIRNCIQSGWKERDDAVWAGYFPPNPEGQIPCPSNRQFLYALAVRIRQALLTDAPGPATPPSCGHD